MNIVNLTQKNYKLLDKYTDDEIENIDFILRVENIDFILRVDICEIFASLKNRRIKLKRLYVENFKFDKYIGCIVDFIELNRTRELSLYNCKFEEKHFSKLMLSVHNSDQLKNICFNHVEIKDSTGEFEVATSSFIKHAHVTANDYDSLRLVIKYTFINNERTCLLYSGNKNVLRAIKEYVPSIIDLDSFSKKLLKETGVIKLKKIEKFEHRLKPAIFNYLYDLSVYKVAMTLYSDSTIATIDYFYTNGLSVYGLEDVIKDDIVNGIS